MCPSQFPKYARTLPCPLLLPWLTFNFARGLAGCYNLVTTSTFWLHSCSSGMPVRGRGADAGGDAEQPLLVGPLARAGLAVIMTRASSRAPPQQSTSKPWRMWATDVGIAEAGPGRNGGSNGDGQGSGSRGGDTADARAAPAGMCRLCGGGSPEDESHMVLHCRYAPLQRARVQLLTKGTFGLQP
jgi:hypothetical protein